MKIILLVILIIITAETSAQTFQAKTNNNVLELRLANGTPIPQNDVSSVQWPEGDSSRLALLINHQATMKYLLTVKKICRRMGLYLNYRSLSFDQGQKLTDIRVDYALRHGNVAVAAAYELTDSTRFGVFGSITSQTRRYYVGFERNRN